MNETLWKIQIFVNGAWCDYGQSSSNFARLYKMCEKFAENGTKARVVRKEM